MKLELPRPMTAARAAPAGRAAPASAIYLAREAVLFLAFSYLLLLGGTFNGLVLYRLNVVTVYLLGLGAGAYLGWLWLARRRVAGSVLDWPVLGLLGAHALAALRSEDPRRSAGAVVLLLLYALLLHLVVDLLRAGWPRALFVKVMLLVSGFIVAAGLWELYRWYAGWLAVADPGHWLPPANIRVRAFLGHPNFVAAFFTLLLPLGLAGMRHTRSRVVRLGLLVWCGLSLVLVFFTSSRAGWLGCTVSLGVAAALLVPHARRRWQSLWQWLLRRRLVLAALAVLFAAAGLGAARVMMWQLQHPTHGGRLAIWRVAGTMLAGDPLTGSGPFTFGTEFIQFHSVPPVLLLAHAHNFGLNTLAETGLVGGAALALLLGVLARAARRRWLAAEPLDRPILAGVIGALCGTAANSLFDTPQTFPALAVLTVVLAALLVGDGPGSPAPVRPAWPFAVAWVVVVGSLGWAAWAYGPFSRGALAGNLGDWESAAASMDTAIRRDSGLAHYWQQAGFAHGQLALEAEGTVRSEQHLALALGAYEQGVALEPIYATNWANLGVLRWASGDPAGAIAALQTAADRAPRQPAFRLTLGRMLEDAGQEDAARAAYAAVLAARPDWSQAYFFRATPLRQAVVAAAGLEGGPAPGPRSAWAALAAGDYALAHERFAADISLNAPEPYLGQGLTYLAQGRLDEADRALRSARFVVDPNSAMAVRVAFAMGQLRSAQGRPHAAVAEYKRGADLLARVTSFGIGTLGTSEYAWYIFNRESVAADLLPGVDHIVYTDDLVPSLLELSALYRRLGQNDLAAELDCRLARAVPDLPPTWEGWADVGNCS